jgi:hypothetical protein
VLHFHAAISRPTYTTYFAIAKNKELAEMNMKQYILAAEKNHVYRVRAYTPHMSLETISVHFSILTKIAKYVMSRL